MSDDECKAPGCENRSTERYTGPHGNTMRVCDRHYYILIKNGRRGVVTDSGVNVVTDFPDITDTDSDNTINLADLPDEGGANLFGPNPYP